MEKKVYSASFDRIIGDCCKTVCEDVKPIEPWPDDEICCDNCGALIIDTRSEDI